MLDIVTAARIFHDWSASEGYLADGPSVTPVSTLAEMATIRPVTEQGRLLLRSKQIQTVGYNREREEVIVFLRRAVPASKKVVAELPTLVGTVKLVYRQGVPPGVGSQLPTSFSSPYTVRKTATSGYYTCGSSISVGNFREAGTLCCIVKNAAGDFFGLSNNHVTGSCNFAGVDLPIVAPGIVDVVAGGLHPFTIGLHHQNLPFVAGSPDMVDATANADAAIFRLPRPELITSFQGDA